MTPGDDQDLTRLSPPRLVTANDDTQRTSPTGPTNRSIQVPADDDATVFKPVPRAVAVVAERASVERAGVDTLLKERFLLQRELGRGGMGVVYLARDERKVEARDRDPYVAVKVLNDEFRRHPDSLVALQREARRTQRLAHPNIVRVYDFDRHGDIVFMTMEYIEGNDLRRVIREEAMGGLTLKRAWPLIEGMARGLQHAHENGVVHSDFKPGNVMVTPEGVAKVFDFGIARAGKFSNEPHADDHTVFDASTLNALTPAYASPDVTSGKPPVPSDDIYALGCVIFELLTGDHPFGKASAEDAIRDGLRPPGVRGLGRRAYRALRDSVAFDRSRRPRSATVLLEAMRPRGWRERARVWIGLAVLLGLVAFGVSWAISQRIHDRRIAVATQAFAIDGTHTPHDETQAIQALDRLDEGERARFILDNDERIVAFFRARLDTYWHPGSGGEDYAGANRIFALRDRLKLFSPSLDARKAAVERERNERLNTLDSRLRDALTAGSLLDGKDDNVPALMARIRALDPAGARLGDNDIELKYEAAIAQAAANGDKPQVEQLMATATRLFPNTPRLRTAAISAPTPALVAPEIAAPPTDEAVSAEAASRIEAVRRAAAAGDTVKAQSALDEVKALQPDNGFVVDEGPRLISGAYLDKARDQARHDHWQDAGDTVKRAMKWLGRRADLRAALERYDLVATIVTALDGSGAVTQDTVDTARKRYDALHRGDAKSLRQLDADIHDAGRKDGLSLEALLGQLQARVAEVAPPGVVGQRPREASEHGLAKTSGADPCNSVDLAGTGHTCIDVLSDDTRGPATVVVPAGDGVAAFAITRGLITAVEFNHYCDNADHCAPLSGEANRPVRKLYLAQARMYASWLSRMTGYRYRLPTDAEWKRAVAGSADCRPSDRAAHGRIRNLWGLIDADGQIGEWVIDAPHTVVRGGGASLCDGPARQDDRGLPQPDVGFRLVRTLK